MMSKLLEDRRLLLPTLATAIAIAIGSVLVITLTDDATGGSADSGGAPPAAAAPAQPADGEPATVEIADFLYDPEALTVSAGTEVTWTNSDVAPHTATADAFETADLQEGDSDSVTLDEPGTFSYVCKFHAFMKGTVVVE